MKFSVIIPVFNVEPYLRECLDSVLHQTFGDWEAICVDDGSIDGSAAILEEYAKKGNHFKVLSKSNGGLSSARNLGLELAMGDYVLFLDSDDWLELNALETVASSLSNEDVLCYSGRRYFEATKTFNPADELTDLAYPSGMDYFNDQALRHRDFAFVCVVLRAYRRKFLLENQLRFKEGIFHEDNLFTPLACFHAQKVRVINACLYDYRIRENSITTTNHLKRLHDLMGTANELAAFFISKQGFDKTVAFRAITHHYQVVFQSGGKSDMKELRELCDWKLYRRVSRTKLRHRWNYFKNRYGLC